MIAVCGSRVADNRASADFIALARNAFDVLQKCGADGVYMACCAFSYSPMNYLQRKALAEFLGSLGDIDAFTAIVEANHWCKANVEKETP